MSNSRHSIVHWILAANSRPPAGCRLGELSIGATFTVKPVYHGLNLLPPLSLVPGEVYIIVAERGCYTAVVSCRDSSKLIHAAAHTRVDAVNLEHEIG